jgi:dTDP-4-dehydrorhamnose reductase
MRLLVTGASGQLGLHFAYQAAQAGHAVTGVVNRHALNGVPFDVLQADLEDSAAVERIFDQVQPEAVVHTAALAYPEQCEQRPQESERLNALLPGWVAAAARRRRVYLLHVSTDAIFDGERGGYREGDLPGPRNTYARHKLAGERAVAAADPDACIVRTVFYGWSLNGRRSLAEWFFNNLNAGVPVRGFTDAFFTPLEATDLAEMLLKMVALRAGGVYHVASRQAISKYEFGRSIARRFGLDETLITPALLAEGGLIARRSANLSLDCAKLNHDLGLVLPDQAAELELFYQEYQSGWRAKVMAAGQT